MSNPSKFQDERLSVHSGCDDRRVRQSIFSFVWVLCVIQDLAG